MSESSMEVHIKRERANARELRKSRWWKEKIHQNPVCHYCERKLPVEEVTMDHLIPLSQGGMTTKGNVVIACKACNNEKKSTSNIEMILKSL